MSRIDEAFARARAEDRIALMPFMTAGYPDAETSLALVRAMVEAGADGIELGIPFSDPLADGPTIQKSSHIALQGGATPGLAVDMVRRLREAGVAVPLILMGYFNTFLACGEEHFISDAARAGADGFIIVDLPPEESDSTLAICRRHGLDLIYLVAPTSDEGRIAEVLKRARGFIYSVGVVGITGARGALAEELPAFLRRLRERTDLPLAVGFGISKREHIETLTGVADAAIVASALIDIVESSPHEERVERVKNYVEVLTGRTEAKA
ncbi:MAG: tryptophan synthase subunit alpha [Dehalococcoidia bacterium]